MCVGDLVVVIVCFVLWGGICLYVYWQPLIVTQEKSWKSNIVFLSKARYYSYINMQFLTKI